MNIKTEVVAIGKSVQSFNTRRGKEREGGTLSDVLRTQKNKLHKLESVKTPSNVINPRGRC